MSSLTAEIAAIANPEPEPAVANAEQEHSVTEEVGGVDDVQENTVENSADGCLTDIFDDLVEFRLQTMHSDGDRESDREDLLDMDISLGVFEQTDYERSLALANAARARARSLDIDIPSEIVLPLAANHTHNDNYVLTSDLSLFCESKNSSELELMMRSQGDASNLLAETLTTLNEMQQFRTQNPAMSSLPFQTSEWEVKSSESDAWSNLQSSSAQQGLIVPLAAETAEINQCVQRDPHPRNTNSDGERKDDSKLAVATSENANDRSEHLPDPVSLFSCDIAENENTNNIDDIMSTSLSSGFTNHLSDTSYELIDIFEQNMFIDDDENLFDEEMPKIGDY